MGPKHSLYNYYIYCILYIQLFSFLHRLFNHHGSLMLETLIQVLVVGPDNGGYINRMDRLGAE